MTKMASITMVGLLASGCCLLADSPPEAEITNNLIHARIYLPDPSTGFYRGSRFDWSGAIRGLEYSGHNYYCQWFQKTDPAVHDFTYRGAEIVAGPCTAITGPAEEFVTDGKALGFDETKAGGTFIKIGVGVLRKPDNSNYDPFRLYTIQDGGRWTVVRKADAIEFRQELADPSSGYAYDYRKIVSLTENKAEMILDHTLRNTGKRAIQTSVYNHNFLYLDRQPPGPDFFLTVPFKIRASQAAGSLAEIQGNQISFSKTVTGEERVYLDLQGFGADATDYDFRIENRKLGAGIRITGNRPLCRVALWAIRAPLSIEPFIQMTIAPGAEFTWKIKYQYYSPVERP